MQNAELRMLNVGAEPEWNWLTFLEGAIEHQPTEEMCAAAGKRARNWPTCACGQLCQALPREEDGAPVDSYLEWRGIDFMLAVDDRKWPEALQHFHYIEARTAELLAAMAQQDGALGDRALPTEEPK